MIGLGKIGSNLSSLRIRWKSTRYYVFYCQSEMLTPSKGEWQIFSTFGSPKNQIVWKGALWGSSRYKFIIVADYNKYVIYTVQTLMLLLQQGSGHCVTSISNMETQIPTCTLRGKDKVLITTLLPKLIKLWYVSFTCSFHNQLKTIHLNGKVNCRVDYLIHYLLCTIWKRCYFQVQERPSAMNRKLKLEMSRHAACSFCSGNTRGAKI